MKRLIPLLVIALAACSQTADTNPIKNDPMLADQKAQEKVDQEQSTDLGEQVISGAKSLDQATGDFDGGEWDWDRQMCLRHFIGGKSMDQHAALQARIVKFEAMSTEHDAALAAGKDAAETWVKNHPDDYVNAIRHAFGTMKKAKLLPEELHRSDKTVIALFD